MKVRDVMTENITMCRPTDNLASLASLMWRGDCGAVPVVDEDRRPVGIITDRDAFIALATRFRTPGEILVQEVMTQAPTVCRPEDDIHVALRLMSEHQVRRLPIVDPAGALVGMLSLSDLAAQSAVRPNAMDADLARTLEAISRSHRQVPVLA